jgi:polyhydroxybutyrate depolymerase
VPASYNATKPAPLILNLHGYTSNNLQQEFYGDFRPIADTAGFLLVHPNGTLDNSGNRYWNVGFFPSPINDVGFLLALIDSLSATYNINQNRIYSTGMSNGGFMSYKLACETNRFAAIASVTGSITTSNFALCAPTKPTPVMEIHGTADNTVPYLGTATFLPIDSVVNYWVKFNHCDAMPTMTNVPNINTTDGATAEHYVYANGDNGVTVEHYKVIGGAHTWPGAAITIDVTCKDFSASKEIWRFFNQYSLTSEVENAFEKDLSFSLSPNPANEQISLNFPNEVDAKIEMRDMQGRILKQVNFRGQFQQLNVGDLAQGMYFIRVQIGDKEGFKSFVK